LFYTDDGDTGTPVLLVHGWACDSADWIWQLPALARRHRVIAPDLAGHGRSAAPARGFAPADFADDLAHLAMALKLPQVTVIGHSMGAIIASVLTVNHPDLVSGLVVVDPPYGFDSEAAADNLAFARAMQADDALTVAAARLAGAEGPSTPPALVAWHQRRVLGSVPEVLAGAAREVHGSLESMVNIPHIERHFAQRRVPVLAVHATTPRARWEEKFLTQPGSRAVGFDGAGHWLHQERPDEFNELVLNWIEAA
jgi:pimeloyl-ACP methyl ester carboxylesterase